MVSRVNVGDAAPPLLIVWGFVPDIVQTPPFAPKTMAVLLVVLTSLVAIEVPA
jgi:hypothetical protein